MFLATQLVGFGGTSAATATVTRTFAASTGDGSDLTTYNYVGVSISTAASNRKVVVCCMSRAAGAINSVTVAGVSATLAVSADGSNANSEIWVADVPTGTTANIDVVYSTGKVRAAIAVYAMYGAASSTPTNTYTDTATPWSQSINVPAGGVAFACQCNSDNLAFTWAGLTEDYDADFPDAAQSYTGASAEFSAAQTGLTVSVSTPTDGAMAIATFGP